MIPDFPINGQWGWFMAMVLASIVYVIVSLLTPTKAFNLDRLLHRGEYEVKEDHSSGSQEVVRGWKVLAPTKEFTRGDKAIYWATTGWTAAWVLVFFVGTLFYFFVKPFTNEQWFGFWKVYTYLFLGASIIVTVWFTIGGLKNLKEMIYALRHNIRDHKDDGFVKKADQ
jgi:SSS family solute:Na+ symporter